MIETIHAAGILFVTPDKKSLFLKRSEYGDFPGYFDLPGGKREPGENIEDAAIRECQEEIGFYPSGELFEISRRVNTKEGDGDTETKIVDYTTFIQEINEEFTPPKLDFEHLSYKWAPLDKPPKPLHPGLIITLRKYFGDELEIAELMSQGELTSPQRYGNITLFNMRITGTGLSYRSGIKEYVWRDSSLYLTERFVKRCNGLPVIFEHPKSATLNTKEYIDRNIGSVFVPYIKNDEVWAIVKVWDDYAARLMAENQLSTSPAVVLTGDDEKIKTKDGQDLLIEGVPKLLDHLAICFQGVWDKLGPPKGIETTVVGDLIMADDDKAAALEAARKADAEAKAKADAEAKAKADAGAGEVPDKVLKCIDSLTAKMDAWEEEDKKRKADKAQRKADKQARKDAARARRDMDKEEREKADAKAKADAEAKAKADAEAKAKTDAEAEEKKRADAEAEVRQRIADVEKRLPKQMTDADYTAMADAQVTAHRIYLMHGKQAPRPMEGETTIRYRRRLANELKEYSPAWKDIDLSATIKDEAFPNIEKVIYADAEHAGLHPVAPSEDFLREIVREDVTGRKITEFVGRPMAWMGQFAANKRRLAGIRNR
jgi:8-oxo-dGTP pyrophosphatase MutT (NUDIX family)